MMKGPLELMEFAKYPQRTSDVFYQQYDQKCGTTSTKNKNQQSNAG